MSTGAAAALPLPSFWELAAPRDWQRIDLISDLHLQQGEPGTFDAFAAYLHSTAADAVLILGDLFEVWVGDDARFEGFDARCTELLQEASSRLSLSLMAGNRDFLVGAEMLRHCGITALPDPSVLVAFGERVLLTHGDALCLADTGYQRVRAELRSEAWRTRMLALPLAQRRAIAAQARSASQAHQAEQNRRQPEGYADVDAASAVQWMHQAAAPVMIHGHTHRPGTEELAPGFTRMVLSDWELDHQPPRAEVLRLSARGFERLALDQVG
ncbi:UDP-2,3-diacylglucosamine diphosphatase [Rivibacter subsaxonicus]|uniref:UDP-2,3-diacylglucosamine hydrolase n=1 Tax=Rivibacter subsaxonicus TaxID=457575 RepID=A0A4Q7VNM5_9BURK|nr:UDP-2,3-diacylglucosamine diphosphatase [Rivibacter subsaxonicus]RZT97986.1 UDP-2,3-diacylglucosamine hydrolase [Rivibacter subsaxonicus]